MRQTDFATRRTSDVVTKWPAMHKWSPEFLQSRYAGVKFAVGAVEMELDAFLRYAASGPCTAPRSKGAVARACAVHGLGRICLLSLPLELAS